jgi:hypothetical protein
VQATLQRSAGDGARASRTICDERTRRLRIVSEAPTLHLLKLCVGADGVEDLADWRRAFAAQARAAGRDPRPRHTTRQWPKRAEELLAGGSLYWVFKGMVLARQRILALEVNDGADGVRRCGILLDDAIVRTVPQPRRPFQGWRYLPADEAPADLTDAAGDETALPPELSMALADLGVAPRRARRA